MADEKHDLTDEQLLDFLAGRSSDADAEAIDAATQTNLNIAADLALMQGAKAAFADQSNESSPGAFGWARLERALKTEQVQAPPSRQFSTWQVAAAAAVVAVGVWQFAAQPLLIGSPDGYVTATGSDSAEHSVQVAFVPNATEADIRALLLDNNATVTSGPSAIGLWQVSFDTEAARDAALAQFAQSPQIVESAQAN